MIYDNLIRYQNGFQIHIMKQREIHSSSLHLDSNQKYQDFHLKEYCEHFCFPKEKHISSSCILFFLQNMHKCIKWAFLNFVNTGWRTSVILKNNRLIMIYLCICVKISWLNISYCDFLFLNYRQKFRFRRFEIVNMSIWNKTPYRLFSR